MVVLDDEDRENEGDLIIAAEKMTDEDVAFMVNHTSGLICVGMDGKDLDRLELPPMVAKNQDAMGTAFTVSVDLKQGTSTGISARTGAPRSRPWHLPGPSQTTSGSQGTPLPRCATGRAAC